MNEFSVQMDKIRAERLEERRQERVAKRRKDFLEELKEKEKQEGTVRPFGAVLISFLIIDCVGPCLQLV